MKVPCLTCKDLEISQESDGVWFRCSKGLYDKAGVKQYHAITGMTDGNVNIWKATKKCGKFPYQKPL